MATLVYAGGATLTFGSGPSRRTVKAGDPFWVDEDLARILLADPQVRLASAADVPRGTPERPTGPVSVADMPAGATKGGSGSSAALARNRELKARAKELGLPAMGKSDDLAAAIAAEETRLAEEAAASSSGEGDQEGGSEPADDPDASAAGEAGTPPASGTGGAIVLGDA